MVKRNRSRLNANLDNVQRFPDFDLSGAREFPHSFNEFPLLDKCRCR
jgi:hypothetical protein